MPLTMPTAMPTDFRLYRSNSLEVLAGVLADALRDPAPGQPLLAPDTLLIPQPAMRRWLQATLAAEYGIAANLEFLTPGEFVARALDANVGTAADDLDTASLQWRLYAALTDPVLCAQPALARIAAYLAGPASQAPDPLKPWTLAGELAGVFEKYQAWRRDWLLRWDDGADPDDPQAILWRAAMAGRRHRARRIQDYLVRFADGEARPAGLPTRLFAFATINISPDVLRVLATQARSGTLHFFLPTPSQAYWGDLPAPRARLRPGIDPGADAGDNPLLRDWGASGREFVSLLGGYEVVHPSAEIDAWADPLQPRPGQRGGLLQRIQADVFAGHGSLPHDPIAQLDTDDPSLQFHACHTRLRELQVLHDRLHALLEDARFDPPLQPRQIAVLAPDIDPYAPYLDAVFGGRGHRGAIPYALADASPLADEPLAGLFLRLLALPASRFGLEETLDLLASPPLAAANGLVAEDFERLRGWLQAAGARWGLDAAHRARQGAPADDAYTWQFALDRLLLGHAIGADEEIFTAGGTPLAPWSGLEGTALDALDRLLGLMRELGRHARAMEAAMAPAQWREHLLQLLQRLLPRPPAESGQQRALERLRKQIDDFARQAAAGDYQAPLPADVVRAHFAGVLGQADTRAPLLTGGVSFARMVPMRLLPFRVICVLGMNDGDFPRRDPSSGLNRLTAELDSGQRRPGDRSTREDDRFLLLQLLAAAQDVFYLSWLGANPADGSAREPSPLVSDLLQVAADRHADARAARRQLVLHHPLQPFSPTAFGADGDDRHFSYRAQWQAAAAHGQVARRAPLPPWMAPAAGPLPVPVEATSELSLEALRGFLLDPAAQFLRQRLHLRLPRLEGLGEDLEPLQAPERGLERMQLQQAVFDARLRGHGEAAMQASLRARGLLPSGPPGRRALAAVMAEVAPYVEAYTAWRGDAVGEPVPLEVVVDGVRLQGRIDPVFPRGIARLRFGTPNGRSTVRNGLDWLLACAAGLPHPFVEFHEDDDRGVGPHRREVLSPQAAIEGLRTLLALREQGLRAPLPLAPYSSWALFEKRDEPAKALDAAARKWRGNGHGGWAEGEGEALRVALRGRDPFADHEAMREFARLAGIVFGILHTGAPVHIDIDALPLPDDDSEGVA